MNKVNLTKKEKFKLFFKNIFNKLDNLFFPEKIKCLLCNRDLKEKQDIEFCEGCLKKLQFLDDNCCKVCGKKLKSPNICLNCNQNKREFDLARSIFVYDENTAKLLRGFKYKNRPYLKRTLGNLLSEKYKELKWNVDFIIPVPISKKTRKKRGFNQTEFLADEMSKGVNIEVLKDVLIKAKDTKHQAVLNYTERQENLKQSFEVIKKETLKDKNVLLLDDVFTTGATLGACSKCLKDAGAKRVFALTVATTTLENEKDGGKKKRNK